MRTEVDKKEKEWELKMKNLIIATALFAAVLSGCTFVMIDKGEIGYAGTVDVRQATTVNALSLDFKGNTSNAK